MPHRQDGPVPNESNLRFIWNAENLTVRENQMVGALLEMFMMNVILLRQVAEGATQATPAHGAEAIRLTVEWGRRTFPDLHVAHRVSS